MNSMERILSRYPYAEARLERTLRSGIRISDDEIKVNSGQNEGLGVRVLEKGSWGFASGRIQDLETLLKKAQRLARLAPGNIKLPERTPEKKAITAKKSTTSSDSQVERLLECSKEMKGNHIASRMIDCSDIELSSTYCNSEGTEIIQEAAYSYLSCSCVAKSGGLIQRGSERSWSRTGFRKLDFSAATVSKEKAQRLLDAKPPPKGRFTVVFDPEMTGVFSHEAVGHACEADAVLDKESILGEKMGTRIGSELVTIADDPAAGNFGHYEYDDEGTKAEKVFLVEKGILKGFMNSLETAQALGHRPNGHARAESFDVPPVVRMSNTYFQKGESGLDEVFDIKEGVYLKGMRGGSVDIFSGGFMFKAEEAYRIRDGEKTDLMRDTTVTGNILETMLAVECAGNDFGTSPGMCGKSSQGIPVSDGGPHIRVARVAIG